MGLFKSSKPITSLPWVNITSTEQIKDALLSNKGQAKLVFKHSTRCGISRMALSSFESTWSTGNELCELYYLDLLKHRDVSNSIAEMTGVVHQSPQVIVVKGDEIIYDASHSAIDARQIESILKKG